LMKTGDDKMSKSKGNEIVVTELLKRHQAETLRFFLLSTHYRRPIDYSEERLEEVRRGLDGFHRFFERFERITGQSFFSLKAPQRKSEIFDIGAEGEDWEGFRRQKIRFFECMDDDFNTGGAIGCLYDLLTSLNRYVEKKQLERAEKNRAIQTVLEEGATILRELTWVLGLFMTKIPYASAILTSASKLSAEATVSYPAAPKVDSPDAQLTASLIQLFIDLRAEARKNKNFALADQIRQRLSQLGVTLEDRPGGTGWRLG
jgi:cysteinyl-tRNA synthetase